MENLRKIFCLVALLFAGTLCAFPAPQKGKVARAVSQSVSVKNAPNADSEDELFSGKEDLPGENFDAAWPATTRLADMLPARTVQDGPTQWIFETQHFRFVSDAPIALATIKEIARVFEGTYEANLALPLNSPCNHHQVCDEGKFNAFLFETYDRYVAAGAPQGSAGVYINTRGGKMSTGKMLVPFTSLGLEKRGNKFVKGGRRIDSKTLSHEITHHMTIGENSYPIWFVEGLAEYVCNTPYSNGRFNFAKNKTSISKFVGAYGEDRRGRALGSKPAIGMSLEQFMTQSQAEFLQKERTQISYGFSALLIYYFFHLDGKRDAARIKKFITILQNGGSREKANEALLDGRTWASLEKEVARRMKSAFKIEPRFP